MWLERVRDEAPSPEVTLTCCDCGEEATTTTRNREAPHGPWKQAVDEHGFRLLGEALQHRQHRVQPRVRILPKNAEAK